MTINTEQLGYDTKPAEYFQCPRPEMLPFVPSHCRRVLDVGCAEGAFGESIKKGRGIEVWGVEPTKSAAATASTKLDRVIQGVFGPEIALPAGYFDCILFNDVLEHMLVPEMALRYARDLLAPGGVVVASIPNIRNFPTVWELIFHARWEYKDRGILDKTHLRFFTKSSIVNMFEREKFALESVCGIRPYVGIPNASGRLWMAYRVANALCLGKFDDMKFLQFAIVGRPIARPV
jgi:2-polyprenyl-3-methyl-5-hydroxy-6-metoxy-1,4-benzoquinol methylase